MTTAIEATYERTGSSTDYQQPEKMRKLAAYVDQQVDESERMAMFFRRQAAENSAYYSGFQWVDYDTVTDRTTQQAAEPWQAQMVLNYIRPKVDTLVAKLTQERPSWLVAPRTSEDDDAERARACQKLLDFLYENLEMPVLSNEWCQFAAITGLGVMRVQWDPMGGQEFESIITKESEEEDPETGETLKVQTDTVEQRQTGWPLITVVPPQYFARDPGSKRHDLKDCRWVAETTWMHIDDVRLRWPKTAKHIVPEASYTRDSLVAGTSLQDPFVTGESANASKVDRCKVVTYIERESPRYKKGLYAVVCQGYVLESEEEMPCEGELPYVVLRVDRTPGAFAGQGLPTRLMPAQDMLNRQISRRLEVVALNATPKWAVEKGSIDGGALTNEPGEVIMVNKGYKAPAPIAPPPVSPEFAALEQAAIEHIERISGMIEVNAGVLTNTTQSGRAMAYQQEIQAAKLGSIVNELESSMRRLGSMLLKLWQEYMPIDMTVHILGESKKLEAVTFQIEDINSTDVRIEPGSMLAKSLTVQRELANQAFERGGYGPPTDPSAVRQYRKDMEFGSLDFLYGDDANGERTYAREENTVLMAGGDSTPQPTEDHEVHIDEHKKMLHSVQMRQAQLEQPDLFNRAMTHVAEHERWRSMAQSGQPWWQTYLPQEAALVPPPNSEAPPGASPAPNSGAGMVQPPPIKTSLGGAMPGVESAQGPGIPAGGE